MNKYIVVAAILIAILIASPLFAANNTFLLDTGNTLKTSLISYYKLEDTTDTFGGLTLTNGGSPPSPFDAEFWHSGINFGSSNPGNFLSSANNHSYNGGAYTFACWINISGTIGSNARYRVIMSGDSTTKNEISLDYFNNAGTLQAEFYRGKPGAGADFYRVNQTFTIGTWYHFVGRYDGSTLRMYVNGAEIGSGLAASGSGSAATTNGFNIGSDTGGTSLYSGKIDECGVWTKALSAQEITDLYNAGHGQTMVNRRLFGSGLSR